MMSKLLTGVAAAALIVGSGLAAQAQQAPEFTIRMQTHFGPETTSGKNAAQFVDDVETMSNGRIDIELFFSSSVVKSVETFDAAASGILDADLTGGAYQTGKNPAFQFVGDILGGYDTPWQMYAWLYNGGEEVVNELYNEYGMEFIGWWIPGPESLATSEPIATAEDLRDWKFRSPPGMQTEIFAAMGASPVVMDFTEVFTALESGIIDGADASNLANNKGLGLYDLVKYATYPGFHSMPADHLAIRKDLWDSMPPDLQRIVEVAMQKLAFQTTLSTAVQMEEAAAALTEQGVTLLDWSDEDRAKFREVAQQKWEEWGDRTPEARALVDSHIAYMKKIGLIED